MQADKPLLLSIATNGFARIWRDCLESHHRYARRNGYRQWVVTDVPWATTAAQASWLKIELIRGLLVAGCEVVAFIDADCEIRDHTPPLETLFDAHPGKVFLIAPGKSGRPNAGVMIFRRSEEALALLSRIIENADTPVPKEDATRYENGAVIFHSRDMAGRGLIDHRLWNNNSTFDAESYIQHYSNGAMRRTFEQRFGFEVSSNALAALRHDAERGSKPGGDLGDLRPRAFLVAAASHFGNVYPDVLAGRS